MTASGGWFKKARKDKRIGLPLLVAMVTLGNHQTTYRFTSKGIIPNTNQNLKVHFRTLIKSYLL
jgi:hypothetical protein